MRILSPLWILLLALSFSRSATAQIWTAPPTNEPSTSHQQKDPQDAELRQLLAEFAVGYTRQLRELTRLVADAQRLEGLSSQTQRQELAELRQELRSLGQRLDRIALQQKSQALAAAQESQANQESQESQESKGERRAPEQLAPWGLALAVLFAGTLLLLCRELILRRRLEMHIAQLRGGWDRTDSQPESAVVSAEREAETPREELPAEEALETDATREDAPPADAPPEPEPAVPESPPEGELATVELPRPEARPEPRPEKQAEPPRREARSASSPPAPRLLSIRIPDSELIEGASEVIRALLEGDARVLVEPPPSLEERVQGGLSVRFFVRGDLDGASAEDLRQACWDLGARSDPPSWRRSADRDPEQPES
jgi:hypothetical protein